MARVQLVGVTKEYRGGVRAVSDLSLDVPDGELMVLVGPSGGGKTTVLRMIAGLEAPTRGEIVIGGRPADGLPPKDRDVAMVFQDYALYPHLTAAANLRFALKMRRVPREEIRRRIEAVADVLSIRDALDRRPHALSGGQQQRVALGRAMVREPAVFLLDEPLSNLDAQLRRSMRAEIRSLQKRLGATMIWVTHDRDEALALADRVAVIRAGRLEQSGTPEDLRRTPANAFVAEFFGDSGKVSG